MKKIILGLLVFSVISFNSFALAKGGSAGNQVQNQNQTSTQNKGEESNLQINTQEQENLSRSEEVTGTKSASPRSSTAIQQMSVVAGKVEELLTTIGAQGGIGEEISKVAQSQKNAQTKINNELEKIDKRGNIVKKIIGPDYQALKNMEQLMEQNRLRIQQLEQLKNQVYNYGESTMIQETIQTLTDQNIALADKISLEEKTGSLFGWFFKFFTK